MKGLRAMNCALLDFRKESINSLCDKLLKIKQDNPVAEIHCNQSIAYMLKAIMTSLNMNYTLYVENTVRENDILIISGDIITHKIEVDI
jgi:hypothetical protein